MQRTLAYADCAACFLPTAAMLLIAAALSITGIRPLPLLTLWGAVVANEVKDLARETAKATEEVGEKVAAIQTDAGSVVDALHQVAQTVERINEAQNIISGVLTEQNAVTRSVLEQG